MEFKFNTMISTMMLVAVMFAITADCDLINDIGEESKYQNFSFFSTYSFTMWSENFQNFILNNEETCFFFVVCLNFFIFDKKFCAEKNCNKPISVSKSIINSAFDWKYFISNRKS